MVAILVPFRFGEIMVLFLLVVFILVLLVFAGILLGGGLFLQGYMYSEPAEGIFWRAPAAALALALYVVGWCFLNYRAIDARHTDIPFHTLFLFSAQKRFPEKPCPWLQSRRSDDRTSLYERVRNEKGQSDYVLKGDSSRPWNPEAEGSRIMEELVFLNEEMQPVLTLKIDPQLLSTGGEKGKRINMPMTKEIRYIDVQSGRAMTEAEIRRGQMSYTSWSLAFANLLLNFGFLALWLVCLWLLLDFQCLHALGLAMVMWLIMLLAVLPPLFEQTRQSAKTRKAMSVSGDLVMPSGCALGRHLQAFAVRALS